MTIGADNADGKIKRDVSKLIKEHFLTQADPAMSHWCQEWDHKMTAMLEEIEELISPTMRTHL